MRQFPFAADPIIDEESAPYPVGADFAVEELRSEGYRRCSGSSAAACGTARSSARRASTTASSSCARAMDYLMARDGEQIVGAIGFTGDALEQTIRVIELQFLPAAYVPAIVFHEVERLDIIKMVRIPVLEDLGLLALEPAMQGVADLVMRGFAQRAVAPRMAQAIREVPLFAGMTEEQATRLAGMGAVHSVAADEPVFAEGQRADSLHLVLKGQVRISHGPAADVVGVVGEGETLGELSLLTEKPHSASAIAATDVDLGVVTHADLTDLIRPRHRVIIYRNLARGLGRKLQRTSWPQADVDLT